MVIEALSAGALIKTFQAVHEAVKMDERVLKKYALAFEKNKEADMLVKEKAEYADKRLINVARKKRAVMEDTVPKFAKVYGQIQKVNISCSPATAGLLQTIPPDALSVVNALSISVKKEFTDKELICGLVLQGFNKMMIRDSERFLSAANNQLRAAEVVYSQAQSVCAVYDAVIARADRIAKLLTGLNVLFMKSIQKTEETIEHNGYDVKCYSPFDLGVLMTCVNFAAAVSDIIRVPVVDPDGRIAGAALDTIETGEGYIRKMKAVIDEY